MDIEKLLSTLVEELKKYHPKRVILFGSRAKGNFTKHSDIDLAVDLELPFRERRKLREKLDLLAGIYTVDLVFLPYADEEFRKIILEEGKVLYEENRGPAEDSKISKSPREVGRSGPFPLRGDFYRITHIDHLQAEDKLDRDGTIQRFEFTFELLWKALKAILQYKGIECNSPRDCIKKAFLYGVIDDDEILLDMLEDRNLSSHTYDEATAREIFGRIKNFYLKTLEELKLEEEL